MLSHPAVGCGQMPCSVSSRIKIWLPASFLNRDPSRPPFPVNGTPPEYQSEQSGGGKTDTEFVTACEPACEHLPQVPDITLCRLSF